jgi:hypothetical protein
VADLVGLGGAAAGDEPEQGRSLVGLFADWRHAPRERIVVRSAGGDAIVTPSWHLIVGRGADTAGRRMLFAKPDDYFERNDVADRCGGEVEELASALGPAPTGDGR